jgi:hypothetical protein
MRHRCAVVVFCCSLSIAATCMTPEEAAIRNAYAKLSYAVDINTAYRAALGNRNITPAALAKQVAGKRLSFKLGDFTCGNLADIGGEKYLTAFPQYPDGQDVIQISEDTEKYAEGPEDKPNSVTTVTARAEWVTGPIGKAPDWTVAKMIPVAEKESGVSPLVRYCTFSVTATLGDRSRTYQSEFMFGAKGQLVPGDTVVALGGGAMWYFLDHPAYPGVLLETGLWGNAAVRSFILTNQKTKTSCKKGDACCDVVALQCGVNSADLGGRQP